MADIISIDRLLARAVIGLNEWERRAKQDVLVTARLHLDLGRVGFSDRVGDTLNYGTLIRQLMVHVEASERHTVEALATDVAGICLWHPTVQRVQTEVTKPAADRFVRSVGVTIERTREQLLQRAYIALGSNVEPEKHLPAAAARLGTIGEVVAASPVVRSRAVGGTGGEFCNAVAVVSTCLPAAEVRRQLKGIERELGRSPESAGHGITIDLDLAMQGEQVINAADVRIPHPDIRERAYLARLLAEVEPSLRDPSSGEALSAIAARSQDPIPTRTDIRITASVPGASA
ncbi:MAG: 2-amino-4-hydroxy-6-hydroxymethyldihydropteridine diphosphokinase [Phycisphaerales bacterium]